MKTLAFIILVLMLCGCSSRQDVVDNMSNQYDGTNWESDVIPICIWSLTF